MAEHIRELAHFKPETVLHYWSLAPAVTPVENSGLIGCRVLYGQRNYTEPVVSVDPASNRVMVVGGKVYELGTPAHQFAAQNPHILEEVGMKLCCD